MTAFVVANSKKARAFDITDAEYAAFLQAEHVYEEFLAKFEALQSAADQDVHYGETGWVPGCNPKARK